MTLIRVHLRVHGYVQGVSFRFYAQRQARLLGLAGWVRNCPDGTVEAVVQGDDESVRQFVAWAHQGPGGAEVRHVDAVNEEPDGSLHDFRIVG